MVPAQPGPGRDGRAGRRVDARWVNSGEEAGVGRVYGMVACAF